MAQDLSAIDRLYPVFFRIVQWVCSLFSRLKSMCRMQSHAPIYAVLRLNNFALLYTWTKATPERHEHTIRQVVNGMITYGNALERKMAI